MKNQKTRAHFAIHFKVRRVLESVSLYFSKMVNMCCAYPQSGCNFNITHNFNKLDTLLAGLSIKRGPVDRDRAGDRANDELTHIPIARNIFSNRCCLIYTKNKMGNLNLQCI